MGMQSRCTPVIFPDKSSKKYNYPSRKWNRIMSKMSLPKVGTFSTGKLLCDRRMLNENSMF